MKTLIVALLAVSTSAHADVDVQIQPRGDAAPAVEATLIGEPHAAASAIWLTSPYGQFAPVPAQSVRDFRHGSDPIAIAIVVQGSELFMGNDEDPAVGADRYAAGMLDPLEAGLLALDLEHLGPPDSQIMVVTYATGARLRVPLEPLAAFSPLQLGAQRDYAATLGDDLADGVELAEGRLAHEDARVKLLVVIGDGHDTNDEVAKLRLTELHKAAAAAGIRLDALIWKTAISSDDAMVITSAVPHARRLSATVDVGPALRETFARATDRYYVTFAGDALPWTGQPHDVVVRIGGTSLDPVTLDAGAYRMPAGAWWRSGWAQLVAGGVLVALLILGVKLSDR